MKNLSLLIVAAILLCGSAAEVMRGSAVKVVYGRSPIIHVTKYPRIGLAVTLRGVDCPEESEPGRHLAEAAVRKIAGQDVVASGLVKDRFGTLYGTITLLEGPDEKRILNELLIAEGLCRFYPTHFKVFDEQMLATTLQAAQHAAQEAKRGLWDTPPPSPARTLIIGDSSRSIYRHQGCAEYRNVSSKTRVFFTTAKDAERKGFQLAEDCR